MKKLITILMAMLAIASQAQIIQQVGGSGGIQATAVKGTTMLIAPAGADTPYLGWFKWGTSTNGALFVNTTTQRGLIRVNDRWYELGGIGLTSLSAASPLQYNNTTGQFSIPQANGSTNGYLSSTDWTTFNNKQGTISLTTTGNSGAATFSSNTLNIPNYTLAGLGGINLSSLSATAPLSYNNGTGAFSISQANGSTNGFLSSTDWTTFNNKQNALTNPVTGTGSDFSIAYWNGTNTIAGDGQFNYDYVNQTMSLTSLSSGSVFTLRNNPPGGGVAWDNFGLSLSGIGTGSSYFEVGRILAQRSAAFNAGGTNHNSSLGFYTMGSGSIQPRAWIHHTGMQVGGAVDYTNGGFMLNVQGTGNFTGNLKTNVTASRLVKTDANSILTAAVAGTDFVEPSALSSYVPTSRQLTINGTMFDLSANRSWTIPTHDAVTLGTTNGLSLAGQQLSLGLASTSTPGALSSTDWNTFNNKQNALTNPVTGTGASGQVAYWNGTTTQTGTANFTWDNSGNRMLVTSGTDNLALSVTGSRAKITNAVSGTGAGALHLGGNPTLYDGILVINGDPGAGSATTRSNGQFKVGAGAFESGVNMDIEGITKLRTGGSDVFTFSNTDNALDFQTNTTTYKRWSAKNAGTAGGSAIGFLFYNDLDDIFQFYHGASTNNAVGARESMMRGSGTGGVSIRADNGAIKFNANSYATEIARFTSTGLGIGNTNPQQKLDVTGTIRTSNASGTGTRVATANASGDIGALNNGSNGQVLTLVSGAPAWQTPTSATNDSLLYGAAADLGGAGQYNTERDVIWMNGYDVKGFGNNWYGDGTSNWDFIQPDGTNELSATATSIYVDANNSNSRFRFRREFRWTGETMKFRTRLQPYTAASTFTASNCTFIIGMVNVSTPLVTPDNHSIWFEHNPSSNAGNWTCKNKNGSGTTTTNTTHALINYDNTEFTITFDGTTIKFFINNSLKAQHTTNLPSSGNWYPFVGVSQGGSGSSVRTRLNIVNIGWEVKHRPTAL